MDIYIYGTGSGAEKLFRSKLKSDVTVRGFLDSDNNRRGKPVSFASQYRVMGIRDIVEPYDCIVIASIHEEIYYYLLEMNIPINKILFADEYAYNRVHNMNNRNRYKSLEKVLQNKFLLECSKVENLFPQGNYSSAIVNIKYIKDNEARIFKDDLGEESGIELNIVYQLELLHKFSKKGKILPFSDEKMDNLRFYGKNDMFHTPSAHILSHIILTFESKKIIEAGSGFSSATMLDVNEMILDNKLQLTFIEPYPERLKSILKPTDNINLLECNLQEIDLAVFSQLESGDILFIDSSHVSKTGSDVIFEILPILKSGVIVHFHDLFFPFEYPKEWVYEGRGWNENYILRAFLQYNNQFDIIFWENSLKKYHQLHKISLQEDDDISLLDGESLYIRKK